MTDFKMVNEKQIFVIMKRYDGGKIELAGAYWSEDAARKVAANDIASGSFNPSISVFPVTLHIAAMDKA